MCVDIMALIVTLLYFAAGMAFNRFFVDYDNGEEFSIWLMLFWPVVLLLYVCVLTFVCLPWRIRMWFINKFRKDC